MSFFEDDISFSLNVIPLKPEVRLTNGLWLVLAGINEIPPHIALISDGTYYSLSTRRVDCGSPIERLMNALNRSHRPTLFVHIEAKGNTTLSLEKIYAGLHALSNTEKTCLAPIKEVFAESYSNEFSSVNYVFELLAFAEKKKLIKECVLLFYENANSNIVTLPKYTMAQIKSKISELSSQVTSFK
jgi:hypothetical protein